jgi:hypothetical protein
MEMGQWYSQINMNTDHGDDDEAQVDHQDDQSAENSGGQHSVVGGAVGSADSSRQSVSAENPTTGVQSVSPPHSDQDLGWDQDMMDAMDSDDYDEAPQRFRSLDEVYQHSHEVALESDSEEQYNADTGEQENAVETAALLTVMEEPSCFSEAVDDPNWVQAMDNEMQSICKNGTWELAILPPGQKPIGLKWVYKLKKNADGEVVKHKARLVAKGYVQQQGVDFDEVFAPVARLDTIRLILALAANRGWQVHHLDVKLLFLMES